MATTGAKTNKTAAAAIGDDIRSALRSSGSTAMALSSQRFFVEKVSSHGWRAADLRRFARLAQCKILAEGGDKLLLEVADYLFTGKNNDETIDAVLMLEIRTRHFGESEFALFDRWLDRVTNWAQHDGLVHCLIGPFIAAKSKRAARVLPWTKSKDRWRRRAAAVALIQPARRKLCFAQTKRVTAALLADKDDMVQKGLGWLLREWGKADAKTIIPFLISIRKTAPRFVLRTACETLPKTTRAQILQK